MIYFQHGYSKKGMEAILLNKGQQIAKIQEYAEDKIAIEAVEDKQAYASSRVKEQYIPVASDKEQDKHGYT
jgi:hypothetical protein